MELTGLPFYGSELTMVLTRAKTYKIPKIFQFLFNVIKNKMLNVHMSYLAAAGC